VKTANFDFELPRERIADRPARPRDSARLLTVGAQLGDHHVRDLPDLLRPGDLMVLNDTRVIPARLRGRRGEAKVEVTLHRRAGDGRWFAFARPAKRLRAGDRIDFGDGLAATVAEKGPEGEVLLDFGLADMPLLNALEQTGEMPLPPYIPRPEGARSDDRADYQTVYAERPGAVAAPTAGLHFTEGLFRALEDAGIGRVFLTLHVGAGTFLPVKTERIDDHRMHSEWGEISAAAAERINAARDAGGRIVAVGTTSLRLMESAADADGRLRPFEGETDIFITPGVPVRSADLLLTNFHLPRSTLFMLVCAFAGVERMKAAYAHAVRENYRFYSYGDACLLERAA
jgi:S-adenosylmethionine:tRNA ribosyltransferase-isomerase